jgi:DNA-binding response OmpR family regulator
MKKILIVEDDQIVANIYRNKFTVEGFRVEVALDGEAGLETLHSFKPDAMILDLMLPRLTGVDLMKKVRAEAEFQTLPIIVFSNTYLTNLVQEAWKAGATKCLSKANCSPKQLLEVVRSTLGTNGTTGIRPPEAKQPSLPPAVPTQPPPPARRSQDLANPSAKAAWDAEFQTELRESFLAGLPATLAELRGFLQAVIKSGEETARQQQVDQMYRRIHSLTSNAGITGAAQIAQLADALEALLKELLEKPKNINASTLRTVASALDLLKLLADRGEAASRPDHAQPNILVVDDEAISRRGVTYALEKAKLKAVSVEDPQIAFSMLAENRFDLVFLDVDMPGMNGFELCAKLRNLPLHRNTPVVFVTGLNDLESRANSMVSGGNDFIAKPFLFIELAVKALVHLRRSRLDKKR